MTTNSYSPVATKKSRTTDVRANTAAISLTTVRLVRVEGGGVRGVRVGGPQGSRQDVVMYGLTTRNVLL
jgi:hypothetical protein